MFERYSPKARRVLFHARYEASIFGSPYIEAEHLLLAFLVENKALMGRILRAEASKESFRKQIEAQVVRHEPIPTSVDLPLSDELKRVMAYAAEEADRLRHKQVGPEHLLLGLLREEQSPSSALLRENGLEVHAMRRELENWPAQDDQ